MKNKSLISLAIAISLLTKDSLVPFVELQKKVNKIMCGEPEGVDPFLEFKIGLQSFMTILILKLSGRGIFSNEEARLANNAADMLFNGKCGWWYNNHFVNHHAGNSRPENTIKVLYNHLLYEAACTYEEGFGQIFTIPDKERQALLMFKGLSNEPALSLELVAERLKITRERARQLKEHASSLILKETELRLNMKLNFI